MLFDAYCLRCHKKHGYNELRIVDGNIWCPHSDGTGSNFRDARCLYYINYLLMCNHIKKLSTRIRKKKKIILNKIICFNCIRDKDFLTDNDKKLWWKYCSVRCFSTLPGGYYKIRSIFKKPPEDCKYLLEYIVNREK